MTGSQVTGIYGFRNKESALFPSCVQLTLCHYICNCGCFSCPVGRLSQGDVQAHAQWQADGGKRLFMPWDIFERAAIETGQHPGAFMRFHARGEPMLHPQITDMMSFAKKVGVSTVQVFTNGLSLDEELARRVLDTGVDVIEFSIHGHTKTYSTLMGNACFERVVENVVRFVQLRNDLKKHTKVVVSAVDQPGFQTEKEDHRRFWSEYADQVILRPYHSWGGRVPCEVNEPARRHPCPQLWTRLTVGPTGKILFCFNSWGEAESEVVADLLEPEVTLSGVWQSEAYARARAAHLAGDYTLHCCAKCRDWVGSAWGNNSYEALLQKLKA